MNEVRHSTGTQYLYLFLRFPIGICIFLMWSSSIHLFDNSGWDLFTPLFTVSVLSGIIARVIAYAILWIINLIMNRNRRTKRSIPTFIQLNFDRSINRFSFISIIDIAIRCLVYSFGIDAYIIDYFFPTRTLWTDLLGYMIVKGGAYALSWIFLKTR